MLPAPRTSRTRAAGGGLAALILVAGLTGIASPATAAPVCTSPVPQAACGGRVVPEASLSTTFLQFDNASTGENLGATLEAIAALPGADRYLTVTTMADYLGDPAAVSAGGRDLWMVVITDSQATGPKKQVAVSLSVHGLEAAGREGGVRYVEDLARWATDTSGTAHPLYAGDHAYPIADVLAQTETVIGFTNSDGWAAGDLDGPTTGFARPNDDGADLNRDYDTIGWQDRTGGRGIALSEPDTRAWAAVVDTLTTLTTSTDIHGELTTPNDAFSDLIIPAGQWDPLRQEQVDQFSRNMIKTVERKFADDGIVLTELTPFVPSDATTPRQAANVAAAYDIVGYDDSGFMGDWFSQRHDSVHTDVENFLSNLVPNNVFNQTVEGAHVAAVRGNIEATIAEAMRTDSITVSRALGAIAVVDDPNRTSSADGTQFDLVDGEVQVPYDVSRLIYFDDLADNYGAGVTRVQAADLAAGADLSGYDTLVVADMELPAGSTVDKAAYVAALDAFATAGGQLLLTDSGLSLLDDLDVVPTADLTLNRSNAGHVDFVAADHPYKDGLVGLPSQTYYEVMLGYPPEAQGGQAGGPFAPNYGITRTAWEAAGGTTVATVGPEGGSSPNTALGTIARGQGRITVFGAVLPQATETLPGSTVAAPHPYGLADYAVTITGGQVLDNILAYGADEAPTPVVPELPYPALSLLLAVAAAGGLVLRRRLV